MLLLVVLIRPLTAQQTIINMPSVDQTERGRFFALHATQARNAHGAAYWYTTNFLTYGVTDSLEAVVTVFNAGAPAVPNGVRGAG